MTLFNGSFSIKLSAPFSGTDIYNGSFTYDDVNLTKIGDEGLG
jgi:hypothetical protein